jgi:hypothetical protein
MRTALRDDVALGWCGPPEHGVPRLARQLARAARDLGFSGPVVQEPDPAQVIDLVAGLPPTVRLLHLHVSDWLFADAGVGADHAMAGLVRSLRDRGVALSVTLHDLPQPTDGPDLYQRRAATYGAIVESVAGVVVCSEHERTLLDDALLADGRRLPAAPDAVMVIPLPIDPAGPTPAGGPSAMTRTVGIFGYLYPGKGHREVLDELASCQPAVDVLAIGRASDRHRELVADLTEVATGRGMSFRCTGYVPDSEVTARLRAPLIPVAPHTHVSASGSINSWIAAGRRPLVPSGRYASELGKRIPGSVHLYEPGQLRGAVEAAIDDPALTWLPPGTAVGPTTPAAAATYLAWLRARSDR